MHKLLHRPYAIGPSKMDLSSNPSIDYNLACGTHYDGTITAFLKAVRWVDGRKAVPCFESHRRLCVFFHHLLRLQHTLTFLLKRHTNTGGRVSVDGISLFRLQICHKTGYPHMFVSPHPALRQFEMFFLISWAFSQGDRNQVVFARPFTLFKELLRRPWWPTMSSRHNYVLGSLLRAITVGRIGRTAERGVTGVNRGYPAFWCH